MRLPDPIANTTTEAYLAYKAGVLAEGDLKPKLYEPYIHLDAWLAYWAGLVATYPVDKNNDPEMLTDEEAFIAYLSGVTNTYPQEFRDPADIRVAAYLRYLISARWGRPEYPVTNEELYLSMLKTKYIPSGDPSSDIVIDGTAKAPFVDVKMYGDTFQQSYTGKNIFATGNFDYTNGGIRSIGSNGVINSSGTLSQTWGFNIYGGKNLIPSGIIPAGTYTVSITKAVAFPFILGLVAEDNTTTIGNYTIPAGSTSYTFTTDQPAKYFTLWSNYANHSGEQISVTDLGIMIESGSSASSYEPYVGGVPSPNPDYPQQIQTVTGEQTVTVVGKNLISANWESGRYNNSTGAKEPYSGNVRTDAPIVVQPNTTYICSRNGSGLAMNILQYKADGSFISAATISSGNSFTTGANAYFVTMFRGTSGGTEGIQLELGSTITSYAPYHATSYPIDLFTQSQIDMSQATRQDAFINGSGVVKTSDSNALFYIPIKANATYTITKIASSRFRYVCTSTLPAANASVGITTNNDSATSATITAGPADTYLVCVYWASDSQKDKDTVFNSIEITEQAPIELCKLGTYQDYIWKDGEDWKVHKETNKIVVDGSENWVYPDSGANYTFFQFSRNNFGAKYGNAADFYASITEVGFAKADKFEQIVASSANMRTEQGIGFTTEGNGWFRISVANTIATTVNVFKTWLADHPTTVYYALAIATDTTITDSNLIAQLEALVKGGSEEGTTYIKVSASDPNLPGLLYVEAAKDVD